MWLLPLPLPPSPSLPLPPSLPPSLPLAPPPSLTPPPLLSRPPGHLSPRVVSSAMQNKMFRTSLQQDSQEFLRCLLMQIHDETAVEVPVWASMVSRSHDQSRDTPSHRDSMISSSSHDSELFTASGDRSSPLGHLSADGKGGSTKTSPLPRKKVLGRLSLKHKPAGSNQSLTQGSPTNHRRFALKGSSSKRNCSKGSDESISRGPPQSQNEEGSQVSLESQNSEEDAAANQRSVHGEYDVYHVDLKTHKLTLHRNCHIFHCSRPRIGEEGKEEGGSQDTRGSQTKSEDEQSAPTSSETETARNGARKTSPKDNHSTSHRNLAQSRQTKRAGLVSYPVLIACMCHLPPSAVSPLLPPPPSVVPPLLPSPLSFPLSRSTQATQYCD